jgi:hypothetical protein
MGLVKIAHRPMMTRRSGSFIFSTPFFKTSSPHVKFIAGRNLLSGNCGMFS